jgi:predicted alpha/beta hydrolase family esterase
VKPTILFVPGLRDHVAEHWQTLLAAEIEGSVTVPPLEHDKLSLDARVANLDKALRSIEGPVILAAHSAGVLIVVHWAQRHARPIQGALLATPPDIDTPLPAGYPTPEQLQAGGWFPVPRWPLPFPSIVGSSTDDPLGKAECVAALARDWGSRLVDLGAVGHLNPAAGYGPWPRAKALLAEFERPVVKAEA